MMNSPEVSVFYKAIEKFQNEQLAVYKASNNRIIRNSRAAHMLIQFHKIMRKNEYKNLIFLCFSCKTD